MIMTPAKFEAAAARTPIASTRFEFARRYLVDGVKENGFDSYDAGNCEWIESMSQPRRPNKSDLMRAAWKFARDRARVYGGTAKQHISGAMKKAWSLDDDSLAYSGRGVI